MKRKVRLLLYAFAVVIALLVVAMMVAVMFIGRRPALSALPNPNGYDDLLKAGQALAGNMGDVATSLDPAILRALVATNAEALRLLRVGISRHCAVDTDAQIANFSTVSGDMTAMKALARLLSAEGRLAEMENRPADAARSYVDAIRLGSEMSRGGLMLNRLVGIACEGMGSMALVKLLPKLTCDQVRPLAAELERIDDSTVPWRDVMQNENHFARVQVGRYPNPIRLLLDLWNTRDTRLKCEERHDLAAARLRLLIAELALRSYRCDRGHGPESLAQLVPKYLHHVPADPFSRKPLVYGPTRTNWLLYSLGPDRVDDGGKPMGKVISGDDPIVYGSSKSSKANQKGDLLYDSPW